MTQIEVGDLVFDAVQFGETDGEVVLLLHGFPQSSWCWRHVWPSLVEAGYRVVAPDQRGYSPGARPQGVAAYAMTELVGDVLGMLDSLGVERAHVVGHDWGAAVAWQVAARHPDRVRTLTAVSVPHPVAFSRALATDEDQRARSQYMRLFQVEGKAEQVLLRPDDAGVPDSGFRTFFGGAQADADVDRYLAEMHEPGRLTACLNWYRAASRDSVDDFPPVTVPTMYVWSDGDLALGRTAAEATASYVDGPYRFVPLAGVTHWIPEQVPEVLAGLLLEHLRS
jgi:pimeloyl-ACP methyl ester carboxylesterase